MKRILSIALTSCFFGVAGGASAQTAMEKAEKRLADLLAPGSVMSSLTTTPIQWKPSAAVENFTPTAPPVVVKPVRLPQRPLQEVKPRALQEAQPLLSYREQPVPPKQVELPTKPLIRLPSIDVHQPLPIPILAQPQRDRASLGDPTLDVSIDIALKRFTPARTQAVPFVPLNLPDPFENVRAGQLRNPLEENPIPPVIPLQKPTK